MSKRGQHSTGPTWDKMEPGIRERIAEEKIGLLSVDISSTRWSLIPHLLRPLLTEAVQEFKAKHGKLYGSRQVEPLI